MNELCVSSGQWTNSHLDYFWYHRFVHLGLVKSLYEEEHVAAYVSEIIRTHNPVETLVSHCLHLQFEKLSCHLPSECGQEPATGDPLIISDLLQDPLESYIMPT